ncbi:FecR domain-containing protein, partial [bacterium]|nr:FecR domain-containing protein [bacterium]
MKKIYVFSLLMVLFFSINIFAAERAGYIMSVMGNKDGSVQRLDDENAVSGTSLIKKDVINFGDILLSKGVMVKIILDHYDDDPLIMMKSNTKIRIEKKGNKYKKGGITNFFGKLFFKGNGKDHRGFKIITSNAIAGVEGTEFEVEYNPDKKETIIRVFHGLIEAILKKFLPGLNSGKRKQMLHAGDTATITSRGFGDILKKGPEKLNNIQIEERRNRWAVEEDVIDEEEIGENYETDGDLNVIIKFTCHNIDDDGTYPMPLNANILFENCLKLNDRDLTYRGRGIRLTKLEHGASYNMKISSACYSYDYVLDVDKSKKEVIIDYNAIALDIKIPGVVVNAADILKKDFIVRINGKKMVPSYRGLNIKDPNVLYFDTEHGKITISLYLPDLDYADPLTLNLEYIGKLDIKERK